MRLIDADKLRKHERDVKDGNATWLMEVYLPEEIENAPTVNECEDCISREAVLDTTICEGISCNECSFNEIDGEPGCLLHKRIDDLPSVKPKERTGEWQQNIFGAFLCSECGSAFREQPICMGKLIFAFCPACGIRMKKGEENE